MHVHKNIEPNVNEVLTEFAINTQGGLNYCKK